MRLIFINILLIMLQGSIGSNGTKFDNNVFIKSYLLKGGNKLQITFCDSMATKIYAKKSYDVLKDTKSFKYITHGSQRIYLHAEEFPEPNFDTDSFISKNIEFLETDCSLFYRLHYLFMVDTFGNVNPSISGLSYSFNSRPDINSTALRLINRLPNKFKPGEINGQKVNTFLDVNFDYYN